MASVEKALGAVAVASNDTSWPTKGGDLLKMIRDLSPGTPQDLRDALREIVCGLQEAHLSLLSVYMATSQYMLSADPAEAARIRRIKGLACPTDGGLDAMIKNFDDAAQVHDVMERAYNDALAKLLSGDELFEGVDKALPPS